MKLVLISLFLLGLILAINITNGLPVSGEIYKEKKIANNQLAKKYCDAFEKNIKEEDKVLTKGDKEDKVAEEGKIKPKEELKKES